MTLTGLGDANRCGRIPHYDAEQPDWQCTGPSGENESFHRERAKRGWLAGTGEGPAAQAEKRSGGPADAGIRPGVSLRPEKSGIVGKSLEAHRGGQAACKTLIPIVHFAIREQAVIR